jgi:hypothetical protein
MLRNVRRPRAHLKPNYQDSHAVRDKLMQEISDLQAQLGRVEGSPNPENLARVQTFKEMIYSRSEMLHNIDRQKDERSRFGLDKPFN